MVIFQLHKTLKNRAFFNLGSAQDYHLLYSQIAKGTDSYLVGFVADSCLG